MPFNLITKFFGLFSTLRLKEIKKLQLQPYKTQETFLFEILNKARDTEFGKKYHFKDIQNLTDFQKQVPVSTYEEFVPYIEKMLDGQEDVLWPGLIDKFSKSSGTTARSKFLPVSAELLEGSFKAGTDQLMLYLENNPESRILGGKSVFVGGSLNKIKDEPEIYCGDVSAILMHNMPSLGKYFRVPSIETATMDNYELKLEKLAEETMEEDVRSLAGTPTWTIALIKKIVEKKNAKNILEVWPNLEVFFHGAVAFTPYREVFQELIPGDQMHYMEAYNASEGYFALQDDLSLLGQMWLAPDYGIFYEFIPKEEYGNDKPSVYTLDNVKTGVNYVVVITTNAGLWRYVIGDTVEFTSLNPHRIKITGRTKHFINIFGEEVVVHNTDKAIEEACKKTNASIVDYTVGPMFMNEEKSGGHEWIIEFEKEPSNVEEFVDILDSSLREINSDYDAKRHKDIILKKLKLNVVPSGTFYNWLKSKNKLGGQNKVPRLSNSREYIESILEILK